MKILIIGGDARTALTAKKLAADGFYVRCYALDIDKHLLIEGNLIPEIQSYDVVILPLPLTRDGVFVNAVAIKEKIPLSDLLCNIKKSAFILAGKAPAAFKSKANDYGLHLIDYYTGEVFTDKNAYITAEGAIQFVMQSLQKTLRDSTHLIIGGGRIAKHLFIILRGFGASVTLACRDGHDLRWAEAFGAKAIDLLGESETIERAVATADVIYNTVPDRSIPDTAFEKTKKNTMYIELVGDEALISPPLQRNGVSCSCLKALPSRYAPESAGELLYEEISEIIRERVTKQ